MLDFLYYALILIAGLSILIVVHELGHYLPAKLFGMRVEKFFLFFDWPRKIFSFKRGGTEYGIGMLPLGGYVKIAGIIDESMDTEHVNAPVQPWEFRAKPVWQRIIVMVGGVTFNVILGILIFSSIRMQTGEVRIPMTSLQQYGIMVPPASVGDDLGFKNGDIVKSFKGEPMLYIPSASETLSMLIDHDGYFEVVREAKPIRIEIPNDYIKKLSGERKREPLLFIPNAPAIVANGDSTKAGYKAGLRDGDKVLAIGADSIRSFGHMRAALQKHKNASVVLHIVRNNEPLALTANLDSTGILGIKYDEAFLVTERHQYNFFQALVPGTKMAFSVVTDQLKGFGKMFRGDVEVGKSVAGPGKIAKFLGDNTRESGLLGFWYVCGLLSMVLAFMNILPIPALDGGHLVFLLVELVTGREPSVKVRMAAQNVGFFLLLALMAFVLFNDALNW